MKPASSTDTTTITLSSVLVITDAFHMSTYIARYTYPMADDSAFQETMDSLREVARLIRATQHLMHAQGMTKGENYRELMMRLCTALAMTEAAYVEAKRRRDF